MEKETLNYIQNIFTLSKNPICLCSFGKDSMVMLYLIRKINKNIPILFFKEPFFPKKYKFANRIIEEWSLIAYDYPPFITDFISKDNNFEIINWHNGYGNSLLYLPTGVCEPTDKNYLCAIDDLLNKPKVNKYNFLWDTIFVGHKNNDLDPILGKTQLMERTVKLQQMTLALPMINWSDKDIWDYAIKNNVPYNDRRYDKSNNFKEFKDMTYNNDYFPCCYKCLDNREENYVLCPKTNTIRKNISISSEKNKLKIEQNLSIMSYIKSNQEV